MSWLFSQALVEEFSAAYSLDGKPSAQLNVMPTEHKFSRFGKTIEASDLSRFGLTCEVLTGDRGEELLMSFLAASRARTSARPAKVLDSMASVRASGEKWRESLAKYDRASCSWRTAQCSLFEDSDRCLVTWPRWGLMLDGECWELPTLARPISESEFGFWPTPTAVTNTGGAALCKWGGSGARAKLRKMVTPKELNGPLNPEWVSWLMGWPRGWSNLTRLGMDRFQRWLLMPGGY